MLGVFEALWRVADLIHLFRIGPDILDGFREDIFPV